MIEDRLPASEFDYEGISLMGTGLDASVQIGILAAIGLTKLNSLKKINIISGSAFGYFILHAHSQGLLNESNYLSFEQISRQRNGAGFLRGLIKSISVLSRKQSFYENQNLQSCIELLFFREFYQRTLKDFPKNVAFWSYCQNSKKPFEISVDNGYGDMSVPEIIRACISAPFLHGPYQYKDNAFIDTNFSPAARFVRKQIFSEDFPKLIVNFNKSGLRGSALLVKHYKTNYPKLVMLKDFSQFCLNIQNKKFKSNLASSLRCLENHKGS